MRGIAAAIVMALAIACLGIPVAHAAGPVTQRDYDLGLDAFSFFGLGDTPICQQGGYAACTNRCDLQVSSCIKGKARADISRICDPDYNSCTVRCQHRAAACAKH